jgi:alanine racemase
MSAQPAGPAADPRSSPQQAGRGLPSRAVVDLGAIRDNVAALTTHAGSAAVMAVVKADG